MLIAGFSNDSIVDGEGIRFTIFVQGCPHHCIGCHNPQTHSFKGGKEYDIEAVVKMFHSNPLISGITLSGGEPFCQESTCAKIAEIAKTFNLNVWVYTGYTFEQLLSMRKTELLKYTDVLVDGKFEIKKKSLDLMYRGSSNQRLIDVKKSLALGKVILYEPKAF